MKIPLNGFPNSFISRFVIKELTCRPQAFLLTEISSFSKDLTILLFSIILERRISPAHVP